MNALFGDVVAADELAALFEVGLQLRGKLFGRDPILAVLALRVVLLEDLPVFADISVAVSFGVWHDVNIPDSVRPSSSFL